MDLQRWLQEAKAKSGLTLEELGAAVGRSKANVGHWMNGKHEPSYQQVLMISKVTGHALPSDLIPPTEGAGIAHVVSYQAIDTPPLTPWEVVVSLERLPVVPADLMVEVPDDALAARGISRGERIWFQAANSAQPRNVVLIEANGRRYIRRYTEGGKAEALDSAFQTFERDEFKVVAVMYMRPASSI